MIDQIDIKMRPRNTSSLAIVILLLAVIGCSCPKLAERLKKSSDDQPTTTQTQPHTQPTVTSSDTEGEYDVTMAKYEKIKIGTPRAEVERILGGKGTEISSSTGGGIRFSVNKWEGENFASIILTFRNDKVMTRSQVALK